MKIENVEEIHEIVFYVETDENQYSRYRRSKNGDWERMMGESWESWYFVEELEKAFREYRFYHPPTFIDEEA
jgi:hypothetical protein